MLEKLEQTAALPENDNQNERVSDNEKPVSVGKFANGEELWKAYQSLESEFTKKCQLLKELEARSESSPAEKGGERSTPLYEKENWDDKVHSFVEEYPIAKDYATEISSILKSDPELAGNERCLEISLGKAVSKNYKDPESIIEDGEFLEKYVYKNEKIRDKFVKDYLSELSPLSGVPDLITHGGAASIRPPNRAKTFEEAGAMAEKMIMERRL